MIRKSMLISIVTLLTLLSLAVSANPVMAASNCGTSVTVQPGDSLSKIALRCDVALNTILRINPSITNPNLIVPGQVIFLPGATQPNNGSTFYYYVREGDTLKALAIKFNTTVSELLRLNPSIDNPNFIRTGTRLVIPYNSTAGGGGTNVPAGTQLYVVQRGDTLKGIAIKFGTTKSILLQLNPSITNPDLIRAGQVLVVPSASNTYVVQKGDTLGSIAWRFNTTVAALMALNPQITDPNMIFPGQVIRFR